MPTFAERLAALSGGSSFADRLAALEQPKEVDLRTQAAERVKKLKVESAAAEEPGFIRSFVGEVIPSPQAIGTMASAIGARGPEKMFGAWKDLGSGLVEGQADQLRRAKEALDRGEITSAAYHAFVGSNPVIGPVANMTQGAQDEFMDGNIAGGLGGFAGAAANIAGPEAAVGVANKAKALAPVIRANAERQYAGALSKNKSVAPLVEEVAPEMLDRGIKFRDPKELSARAEDAAAAINTDDAVLNMQQQVRVDPIRQELKTQKQALYNEVERVPVTGDVAAATKALKKQHRGAEVVQEGNELVVYKIRHPDMTAKAKRLSRLDSHIKGSADQSGVLTNENALHLRQDYDYYSNPEDVRFGDIPDVRKPADAHVAETLREQINADPVVGAANAEKSLWLDIKKVADATPQGKRISEVIMENMRVAGAGALGKTLGVPLFGELAMGAAALRILRDLPKTAQWRTASAVQKAKFAKALQSGDMAGAARAGADIVSGSAIMDNVIE